MDGLNGTLDNPKSVVISYVDALDSRNYDLAASFISEGVKIIGPAGESFGKPKDFTNMLKRYKGEYVILKAFEQGDDVCLLYDFRTSGRSVYMSSWYRVEGGKIIFIRTIFDPSALQSENTN